MPDGVNKSGIPDLSPWHSALEAWFRERCADPVLEFSGMWLLDGGAVQRNWRLDLDTGTGGRSVVLRAGPDIPLAESRPKADEFVMMTRAFAQGVPVSCPLWLEDSGTVLDRPFLVCEPVPGDADRAKLFAAAPLPGLLDELTDALVRIHAMPVPENLVPETPAMRVAMLSSWARVTPDVPDGIMQGLDWLQARAPELGTVSIVHRDFRTGNFLVEDGTLRAVLDWEFAGAGDPAEDVGWFLACCWRGPNTGLGAGGLGSRDAFLTRYAAVGEQVPGPDRIRFWEVFAHARWALCAMQQGARAQAGEYPHHELVEAEARVPGLARDIAAMVAGS
ncbi:MAG: phosphotransferase family protein [Alphaproteobacteria bacterium]